MIKHLKHFQTWLLIGWQQAVNQLEAMLENSNIAFNMDLS